MKMNKKHGIALVEVVFALALFLIFLSGVGRLMYVGIVAGNLSKDRLKAIFLATEGMEAIKIIRNNDGLNFDPTPASDGFITGTNEYYQPRLSGQTWMLGDKLSVQPPANLGGDLSRFTRYVEIERVSRIIIGFSCTGEIVTPGTPGSCDDINIRRVRVIVNWVERGVSREHRLESLVVNL